MVCWHPKQYLTKIAGVHVLETIAPRFREPVPMVVNEKILEHEI